MAGVVVVHNNKHGKAVEKVGTVYIAGENVNGAAAVQTVWQLLREVDVDEPPQDPAVPLLGIRVPKN